MKSYEDIFLIIALNYQYDYRVTYEEEIEELIEVLYDTNLISYHFELLKKTNQSMDLFDALVLFNELIDMHLSMSAEEFATLKDVYLGIARLQSEINNIKIDPNKILGTCHDFATKFKELCDKEGLNASYIEGTVESDGRVIHHAWNSVVIGSKELYLDISYAIHTLDGSIPNRGIFDYFLIDYDKFYELDGNTERTIISKDYEKTKLR